MINVLLTKIKTRDGLTLDGIVVRPKRKSKTALIWLHGLGSRFSSGQALLEKLSEACARNGIAYIKFNTRGHDIAIRGTKTKKIMGAGFERFEDCVLDIRAMIRFAKKLGLTRIILAGHSTGANKALYYIYKVRDRSIRGVVLLGPISDIAGETKRIGSAQLKRNVLTAQRTIKKKGTALMPLRHGLQTAQRYSSLYRPGSPEDTFPYYNPRAQWKELRSVKTPIAVIIGARDEYLDRPVKICMDSFASHAKRAKSFCGVILKGANHGFIKKEDELTRVLVNWMRGL